MPKPTPSEGSEETKQELPDASDDSDAFDPRVLDGTLEQDAIYGDRTLPGGLKAPRATSLASGSSCLVSSLPSEGVGFGIVVNGFSSLPSEGVGFGIVTVIAWNHAALGGSNRAAIRQPLAWSQSDRAIGKSAAMCLPRGTKAESPSATISARSMLEDGRGHCLGASGRFRTDRIRFAAENWH